MEEKIGGEYLKIIISDCSRIDCKDPDCYGKKIEIIEQRYVKNSFGITNKNIHIEEVGVYPDLWTCGFASDGAMLLSISTPEFIFDAPPGLYVGGTGTRLGIVPCHPHTKETIEAIRRLVVEYNQKKKMEEEWKKK